jgi:hypothetical protein
MILMHLPRIGDEGRGEEMIVEKYRKSEETRKSYLNQSNSQRGGLKNGVFTFFRRNQKKFLDKEKTLF